MMVYLPEGSVIGCRPAEEVSMMERRVCARATLPSAYMPFASGPLFFRQDKDALIRESFSFPFSFRVTMPAIPHMVSAFKKKVSRIGRRLYKKIISSYMWITSPYASAAASIMASLMVGCG